MAKRFIPVAAPVFAGNEKKYVLDCLDSTWISSQGEYLDKFEAQFAQFCGVKHAIAVSNGTVALHLALKALGVKETDEVIVPATTFIATANAVVYCGGKPVFADVEADSWTIDPEDVAKKITTRTRGIVPVHLYGHPADMDALFALAKRHSLFILEDAAEAHGAQYHGKMAGALADAAIFSMYANKIITCGEGGLVTTDNDELADYVRLLKGQGMDPKRRYFYPIIGYNYRMTNICAAIGLAQLEMFDWHLNRRLQLASWYKECLNGIPGVTFQSTKPGLTHVFWMFTVLIGDEVGLSAEKIMALLLEHGIETRPVFYPLHRMPPYADEYTNKSLPVSEYLGDHGIILPSWAGLTQSDVRYICDSLKSIIAKKSNAQASYR